MRARLTPVDASFLRVESPSAHMHVGWSALLAPPANRARPSVESLREHVAARLHRAPRARQRLAFPALGLGEPRWVDDPEFEPAAHVSAASAADEVITLERFGALRDAFLSRPLERRRPPWEVCLVPRLQDRSAGARRAGSRGPRPTAGAPSARPAQPRQLQALGGRVGELVVEHRAAGDKREGFLAGDGDDDLRAALEALDH